MTMETFSRALCDALEANPKLDKEGIAKLKITLCKEHGIKKIPTDIEVLLNSPADIMHKFRKRLQTKPNRSLSGVAPLALMTSPAKCPHGKCTMCPGGIDSPWGDMPQSYTGAEPATMRGMRANFDPYIQVFNRLEQYLVTGHIADKVDVIVMGGTFPARSKEYQEDFITNVFKAMNDFSEMFFPNGELDFEKFKDFFELPGDVGGEDRTKRIHEKVLSLKGTSSLDFEKKRNEKSIIRCIGLTIETKPDWGLLKEGNEMLNQGCTRVELGIQSVYDVPLKLINRGHTVDDNKKSIQILKDLGFKLNFHMMLGLPSVDKEKDIEGIRTLFTDPGYGPDMMKIYPCMVMPGTGLEEQFKRGEFTPITTEDAADIISTIMGDIPTYCRLMRVQRDIPTYRTTAGVSKTNLRQDVDKLMIEKGIVSKDIRARESGRKQTNLSPDIKLVVLPYDASGGREFFISFEDVANDILYGFCRLRFPSSQLREEFTPSTAIVRELHVYGSAVSIGDDDFSSSQHKGYGKKLLAKAEDIAKEHHYDKMLVISGVGVREYYRKFGYSLEGPYMSKSL